MSKFFTLISLFILVFITKNYSQDWKWFKSQGSKNEVFREYTSNIKCFKNAVYVSGTFEDTIVFGQDTLKSGQRSQLFVAKLDTSGKPIWAKQFYAVQHNVNSTSSLEIDKNENIYVGGLTRNITIAGKDTLFSNGNNIGFLSKFTAAGALKFTKQFYLQKGTYGVTGTEVLKVFIDAKNRIHVLGFYGVQLEDTLIIENKKFAVGNNSEGNERKNFIAIYDSIGKLQNAFVFGTGFRDQDFVFIDSAYYLAGANNVGPNGITKIDMKGNIIWRNRDDLTGIRNDVFPTKITIDEFQNLYVSAFGNIGNQLNSAYISKISRSGIRVWTKAFKGEEFKITTLTHHSNQLHLGGMSKDTFQYYRVDTSGRITYSLSFPFSGMVNELIPENDGILYVAGLIDKPVIINSQPITINGQNDFYFGKFKSGLTITNFAEGLHQSSSIVFKPNTGTLTIKSTAVKPSHFYTISIHNLLGSNVQTAEGLSGNNGEISISINPNLHGLLLVRLNGTDQDIIEKIFIE